MNYEEDTGNPLGHGQVDDYERYIIDQGWENYTSEEHETWKILYNRQMDILPGRACDAFMENIGKLGISDREIPDFRVLSQKLKSLTGWEVVAVPGLIPNLAFFQLLANRKFPAGNFIRRRDQLDYIQEPDVFHDLFGHSPLLADPVFTNYMEAYGKGGLRAAENGMINQFSRLYWYTVEFGLMRTDQGLRIYGAGILSSPGESVYALDDPSPHHIAFDLKRMMRTRYKIDDYQPAYFVIDSFQQLFDETYYRDFGPLYEEMKTEKITHDMDALVEGDRVLQRGNGEYFRRKAS